MSSAYSPNVRNLALGHSNELDAIVERFEEAWQTGTRPDITTFVPTDSPHRCELLAELIQVEWELRLKAGETVSEDDYRQRFAELSDDAQFWESLGVVKHLLEQRRSDDSSTPGARAAWPAASGARPAIRSDDRSSPGAMEFGPGAMIGDYEVIEEIARGGMGIVFKARHHELKRIVALKVILMGEMATSELVERFLAEARAAARLEHPGIVSVYDIGRHGNRHFFVMQFVEGTTLAQRLQRGPVKPKTAARLIRQIARAVQYAHERGVVHRDLKPANILIDAQGHPKVSDFGLAKRLDSSVQMTMTGDILGTPSYMAPEQAAGHVRLIGPPADVYALGAILYALLTGGPPFKAGTPLATLRQVLDQDPVPPRTLVPSLSLDLETICLKCLQKDMSKRYPSAEALGNELQRFLDGHPIEARPVGRWELLLRRFRREPRFARSITVVVALLIALAVVSTVSVSREMAFRAETDRHAGTAREGTTRAERETENARLAREQAAAETHRADQATAEVLKLARVATETKTGAESVRKEDRSLPEVSEPKKPQNVIARLEDRPLPLPLTNELPSTTVGDYKIKVQYVGLSDGKNLVSVPTGQLLSLDNIGAQWVTLQNGNEGSIAILQTRPKLVVDLMVEPLPSASKKMMIGVWPEVKAVDDQARSLGVSGLSLIPAWRFDSKEVELPDGKDTLFFDLEDRVSLGKLMTLEGELLVEEGRTAFATFAGKDLTKGATRQVNGMTMTLKAVRTTEQGFEVDVIVPTTPVSSPIQKQNPSKFLQDHSKFVQAMIEAQPTVIAELKDSGGKFHPSVSYRSGGDGGGGSGGFSSSFVFGPNGPKVKQSPPKSNNDKLPMTYYFSRLPEGVGVESLTVSVTQHSGKSSRIPFKLTNIPLPGNRVDAQLP